MKKLLLCPLAAIFITCCSDEDLQPLAGKGTLHVDVGIFINPELRESRLKATVPPEDYSVAVFTAGGTEVMNYARASEMPPLIELQSGQYYVVAHSGNDVPAEFDNPYFYGKTENFSITGNETTSVVVTCELANTMVSVVYSDYVKSSFTSYSVTVSSEAGALTYAAEETRVGFFRTLPLTITAELSYLKPDGTSASKTLRGSIPSPSPKMHYELQINADILSGMSSVQIVVDQSQIPKEVIAVNDDTDGTAAGAIGYGDLLITEIMYDPVALTDTYGEWIELYNNSAQTINLENLVLMRDEDDVHIIASPVALAPGAYVVLARNAQATGEAGTYVFGSAISLTNTGGVLAVYNSGTEDEPGPLIFSVDYGADGFPAGSGTSLCLDPSVSGASAAALPDSWCTSVTPFGTGDLGTPGKENDECD